MNVMTRVRQSAAATVASGRAHRWNHRGAGQAGRAAAEGADPAQDHGRDLAVSGRKEDWQPAVHALGERERSARHELEDGRQRRRARDHHLSSGRPNQLLLPRDRDEDRFDRRIARRGSLLRRAGHRGLAGLQRRDQAPTGAGGMPAFQSFSSSMSVILKDGQSAQYTTATDKVSGEVIKVDVTLNVIR